MRTSCDVSFHEQFKFHRHSFRGTFILISGGLQFFLWDHWHPCLGLLGTSALGFRARVDLFACMFWHMHPIDSSDSPLVRHLLTSCRSAWQPSCFIHVVNIISRNINCLHCRTARPHGWVRVPGRVSPGSEWQKVRIVQRGHRSYFQRSE